MVWWAAAEVRFLHDSLRRVRLAPKQVSYACSSDSISEPATYSRVVQWQGISSTLKTLVQFQRGYLTGSGEARYLVRLIT